MTPTKTPCHCCGLWHTPEAFKHLDLVGYMDCHDDKTMLELRNCYCRSTISKIVPRQTCEPCARCGDPEGAILLQPGYTEGPNSEEDYWVCVTCNKTPENTEPSYDEQELYL